MLFNSLGYLLFLFILVPIHWILPHRFRLSLLAGASLLFYGMWRWEFCFLLLFSAAIDFIAAKRISVSNSQTISKRWLLFSLFINLGLLIFFKYFYFIYVNLQWAGAVAGTEIPDLTVRIILPLGISFYTFQTISYTIDVYRGVQKPTHNFSSFFVYVTFWPQLIAGPILRAGEVLPELLRKRLFTVKYLNDGLLLILIGLIKKTVLADSVAPLVDEAFALDAATLTAFDVWVSVFLFGFQIYFDFSGYSDVAIGSALLLGIRFPENFNWPYLALTPREFWKRWHISLSAWIRDYLYLPLTGQSFDTKSKGGISVAADGLTPKFIIPLFITWIIMGFWHGAGWTFAIWGVYHAVIITVFRYLGRLNEFFLKYFFISWPIMMCLIMASWVPFRAHDIEQMSTMWITLISPTEYQITDRILSGIHYLLASLLTVGMLGVWGCKFILPRMGRYMAVQAGYQVIVVAVGVFILLTLMQPIRQYIYFQF